MQLKDERFAIPGAGALITKTLDGEEFLLIQERRKEGAERENGLIEIPAGKIREGESVYEALRREVREETGYRVLSIEGEDRAERVECNGYSVLSYEPFSSSQNVAGGYPIMVQVFLCRVEEDGAEHTGSDESEHVRWIGLGELRRLLEREERFYPMHLSTLRKFLKAEGRGSDRTEKD